MHSATSLEGPRLVRIVVPCAQTRLPGPRGHRDAFSSSMNVFPLPLYGILVKSGEATVVVNNITFCLHDSLDA